MEVGFSPVTKAAAKEAGWGGRSAARHCLGKGKLRVAEEKRTPEGGGLRGGGGRKPCFTRKTLTVCRVLKYPVCKKV